MNQQPALSTTFHVDAQKEGEPGGGCRGSSLGSEKRGAESGKELIWNLGFEGKLVY